MLIVNRPFILVLVISQGHSVALLAGDGEGEVERVNNQLEHSAQHAFLPPVILLAGDGDGEQHDSKLDNSAQYAVLSPAVQLARNGDGEVEQDDKQLSD